MANTPPELQQLLSESVNRTQYQNPLFQAVTQMAYQGLPTYARQGTSLGQMGPAAPIQQQQDGGGIPDWMKMLGAGLGGAALNSLGPQGNALKALIDGLKKLFGGGNGPGLTGPHTPGTPNLPYQDPSFSGWDPSVSNSNGNPFLPSDPGVYYGPGSGGASPTDPSGGTGVGPGMENYYNNGGGAQYPPYPDPSEE